MLKATYDAASSVVTGSVSLVARAFKTLLKRSAIEEQYVDAQLPSDGSEPMMPALEKPAGDTRTGKEIDAHTHRVLTVVNGDEYTNLKIPVEYALRYDITQSECGNLLHINATYCPTTKDEARLRQEKLDEALGRGRKIWKRIKNLLPGQVCKKAAARDLLGISSCDTSTMDVEKSKAAKKQPCSLLIHLPSETFTFVDPFLEVQVEKIKRCGSNLEMFVKAMADTGKESVDGVKLKTDLTMFRPLKRLVEMCPPGRTGTKLHPLETNNLSRKPNCLTADSLGSVRGMWKTAQYKCGLLQKCKALP